MNMRSSCFDLSAVDWPTVAVRVHYEAGQLANHWGMNVRRLQREFRRQLGITPQRHLSTVRIMRAKALALGNLRTKEISIQLEFRDSAELCRQFRAFFGVSLRTVRKLTT